MQIAAEETLGEVTGTLITTHLRRAATLWTSAFRRPYSERKW